MFALQSVVFGSPKLEKLALFFSFFLSFSFSFLFFCCSVWVSEATEHSA